MPQLNVNQKLNESEIKMTIKQMIKKINKKIKKHIKVINNYYKGLNNANQKRFY